MELVAVLYLKFKWVFHLPSKLSDKCSTQAQPLLFLNMLIIGTLHLLHQHQSDIEDITYKGCLARSQDVEQCSNTNSYTDGLSTDPPPATRTLPDCDQPLQYSGVVGAVESKT